MGPLHGERGKSAVRSRGQLTAQGEVLVVSISYTATSLTPCSEVSGAGGDQGDAFTARLGRRCSCLLGFSEFLMTFRLRARAMLVKPED